MINEIVIEGIDKTGKDLLVKYLSKMCNYRYDVHARGQISNVVYDKLFNRGMFNSTDGLLHDNTLYVLLEADEDDLMIRHDITNEKQINIPKHIEAFRNVFNEMTLNYYNITYNTSTTTPYLIAKWILDYVNEING